MNIYSYQKVLTRKKQGGVTLIETMVGLALGLVVVGAILSTYLVVAKSQIVQLGESALTQNGESAIGFIQRTVREVGLVDTGNDINDLLLTLATPPSSKPEESSDLFGIRNKTTTNSPVNSIEVSSTDTIQRIIIRREVKSNNTADRGCLGSTPTSPISICTISIDSSSNQQRIWVQDNYFGKNSKCPDAYPDNGTCQALTSQGRTIDAMLQVAIADNAAPYQVNQNENIRLISIDDLNKETEPRMQKIRGINICMVIATKTESSSAATQYTGCDGASHNSPAQSTFTYRTINTLIPLYNRQSAMPFIKS